MPARLPPRLMSPLTLQPSDMGFIEGRSPAPNPAAASPIASRGNLILIAAPQPASSTAFPGVQDVPQASRRSTVFHVVDQRLDPSRQLSGIVPMIRPPPLGTHIPASAERLRPVPVVAIDLRAVRDLPDQLVFADLHAHGICRGLQPFDRFAVQRVGEILENSGSKPVERDAAAPFP